MQGPYDPNVTTVHLGQFSRETANEIAGELEKLGIAWSYKQASWFTKVLFAGEWGTRLFVDRDRIGEFNVGVSPKLRMLPGVSDRRGTRSGAC